MNELERIKNRYDAENDMPHGPQVSWVDMVLVETIEELLARIDHLENEVAKLQPLSDEY